MPTNKTQNIVWTCVPFKKNIEHFSTTKNYNNIDCGLPFIKAGYNKNNSEIAIFNKMALEARQMKKTYENFTI
jgi:wobble nucleotide-excising tRNase